MEEDNYLDDNYLDDNYLVDGEEASNEDFEEEMPKHHQRNQRTGQAL